MIRALVLLATIIALGAPAALVTIPWAIVTGNVLPLYNAAQMLVRIAYRVVGIRILATGQQNVPPNTACIFMANHVSNLDPPALLPRIPGRTSAFVKRSLMSIPVFGWGLKLGEFVPVTRDGSASGAPGIALWHGGLDGQGKQSSLPRHRAHCVSPARFSCRFFFA
jgi:1-acyl-sn-glycerol-3-phosphate acyltransferase